MTLQPRRGRRARIRATQLDRRGNLATNVPVDIYLAGGSVVTVAWNQQNAGWSNLGVFNLGAVSKVVVRTGGTKAT